MASKKSPKKSRKLSFYDFLCLPYKPEIIKVQPACQVKEYQNICLSVDYFVNSDNNYDIKVSNINQASSSEKYSKTKPLEVVIPPTDIKATVKIQETPVVLSAMSNNTHDVSIDTSSMQSFNTLKELLDYTNSSTPAAKSPVTFQEETIEHIYPVDSSNFIQTASPLREQVRRDERQMVLNNSRDVENNNNRISWTNNYFKSNKNGDETIKLDYNGNFNGNTINNKAAVYRYNAQLINPTTITVADEPDYDNLQNDNVEMSLPNSYKTVAEYSEYPVSHKYVVGNGNNTRRARFDSSEYSSEDQRNGVSEIQEVAEHTTSIHPIGRGVVSIKPNNGSSFDYRNLPSNPQVNRATVNRNVQYASFNQPRVEYKKPLTPTIVATSNQRHLYSPPPSTLISVLSRQENIDGFSQPRFYKSTSLEMGRFDHLPTKQSLSRENSTHNSSDRFPTIKIENYSSNNNIMSATAF